MVFIERLSHRLTINHDVKGYKQEDDENGWNTVTPNVNAFVVDHEQTSQYLPCCGKIDSISMRNIMIVFHEIRSSMVVSDVVFILT